MNTLVNLICLALVASALAHTTSGFLTTVRSIKQCIATEEATTDACIKVCQAHLTQKDWVSPWRLDLESTEDGKKQCCCKFDDYWGIKEDDDWYNHADPDQSFMYKLLVQPKQCHRLVISLSSKKEKESYELMCRYLKKKRPLTMLELSQFMDSVRFLKSNPPSSSRIKSVVDQDYVPNITTPMMALLEENLELLLDHKREKPTEAPFEVDKINQLTKVTTELRRSLDIDLVHKAFDDLIISTVMQSILGAQRFFDVINRKIPNNSFQSLRGNNGSDPPQDPRRVVITDFSCNEFIEARDVLTDLYESVQAALGSLKIGFTFIAMHMNWTPIIKLKQSLVVYNALINSRCLDNEDNNMSNSAVGETGDQNAVIAAPIPIL